jgi:type IV secretion system protein TrbL
MATVPDGDGWNPIGGIGDVVNGLTGTVSYFSDPWGNTFNALRDAAAGLSENVLPFLTNATLPDLTADWFVSAYRVSFATAIFVAVVLLIPQVVRTARGAQAGRDLLHSMGSYFAIFLTGAMFGPAIGMVLVNFFHSLSDVFVSWGVQGYVDGIVGDFQSMISEADPLGIAGGVPIAVLLMLCMLIGLFLVLVMLVVQLVTLYFTGVLIPLGLVWIIDPGKRSFSLRLVSLWIGILASHPLLFFLLGFAFTIVGSSVATFGNNLALQSLVTLLVAIIALFLAALSPLLLLKFAPIIPTSFGGTNGPSLSTDSIGSKSLSDATNRFGQHRDTTTGKPETGTSVERATGSVEAGGGLPGPSLSEAAATRAASPALAGAGAGASAGGGAGAAGAAAGAGAGAAGSAASASTAATGLAAAGAAESSTGVGAAIGVPTLLLAASVVVASKGAELGQSAAEQAAGQMDETRIGSESTQ